MTAQQQPSSKLFRVSISVLIVGHLIAVFLPPLSLQTRGPLGQSPSIATLFAPLERYCQFLYIDRGYAFFAPEPGPSHLVQAAITDSRGERVEIMFPDLQQQWPRLLYHRHFMLAEYLNEIYEPPGPPAELVELDPEEAEFWVRSRARYERVRQSIVEHLEHQDPGKEVAVRRIEHLIPDLIRFQEQPIELTDPELYRVMLDEPPAGMDVTGNLDAPLGPPETIPPPAGSAVQREESSEDSEQAKPVDQSKDSESPQTPTTEASQAGDDVDKEASSERAEVTEDTKPDSAAAGKPTHQQTPGEEKSEGDDGDADSNPQDQSKESEKVVGEGVSP